MTALAALDTSVEAAVGATTSAARDVLQLPKAGASIAASRLEAYRRFRAIVREFVRDPERGRNPLAQELLDQTLELETQLELDPKGTDAQWEVRQVVDQIIDLVTLLARERDHTFLDNPVDAARFVVEQLDGMDQADIGRLFGVDARTVRDWKAGATKAIRKNPGRVVLAAQLVYDLRSMLGPRGILLWFTSPHPGLGARAPLTLLGDDPQSNADELRLLARSARGQLGA